MIKLRNLKLKNRYFLAPMAEVNDIVFRLLCKKAGAGLTYTGMIHPLSRQKLELDDKPSLQLFSSDEKGIKEFIKKYDMEVSLWDFNLGCPVKRAGEGGYGYFLQDLKMIERILKVMRESTKKPITVKLRKSSQALKIVKIAEKYCDAISIHPRTLQQGYSGKADISFAEDIKKKSKLPIIYSGDVNEANVFDLLEKFDFVMIGREAIGNPNIFAKLTNSKVSLGFNDYLKLTKKYKLPFKQVKFQAINFTKKRGNAKKLRMELMNAKNIEDISKII
ncbi:MAG: tRNA-dihydrouridine synthase family protein [archaeon]